MPNMIWDPIAMAYRYEPSGVQIQGTSFTDANDIIVKLASYDFRILARPFVKNIVIREMVRDGFTSMTSWRGVYDEVVRRIALRAPLALPWRGRNGMIEFLSIPVQFRAALRNLIDNDNPLPGHDRGAHTGIPMAETAGAGNPREYDLSADANGRATRCQKDGTIAYYYSTTHAGASYNYHLIVSGGRPILRGAIDGINRVDVP